MSGEQELGDIPSRLWGGGVFLAPTCTGMSGCGGESPGSSAGDRSIAQLPSSCSTLSSKTCAESLTACTGSTNVRLVCKKGTKTNNFQVYFLFSLNTKLNHKQVQPRHFISHLHTPIGSSSNSLTTDQASGGWGGKTFLGSTVVRPGLGGHQC